jgi:CheY-like chemotaxis protein
VLVYGMAALVTALTGGLASQERMPLIWFLVLFPVLVLGVFAWLVSCHPEKLYAPGDYKDETNYLKAIQVAVSLTAATAAKSDQVAIDTDAIVSATANSATSSPHSQVQNVPTVLWVDDRPENNVYLRTAFEDSGIKVRLALSTNEALEAVDQRNFDVIISDMGRREGPREGYALLDELRKRGVRTPFFVYAGSRRSDHIEETLKRGGQGCTNIATELFELVIKTIRNSK